MTDRRNQIMVKQKQKYLDKTWEEGLKPMVKGMGMVLSAFLACGAITLVVMYMVGILNLG